MYICTNKNDNNLKQNIMTTFKSPTTTNYASYNKKTLYVVFNKRNDNTVLETENKLEAESFVFNDPSLEYSTYPPFTYAPNKQEPNLYDTTFLEY